MRSTDCRPAPNKSASAFDPVAETQRENGNPQSATPTVEALWAAFARPLRRFFRARLADKSAADDLVQEVFAKVHRRIGTVRDSTRLQDWIYRIARRVLIDHLRRVRPSEPMHEAMLLEENGDGDDAIAVDLKPAIRCIIASLAPEYREALILTEFQGISQIELARRLGISVSGAKSRVQRGRNQIKRMLDACCRFEFDRRGRVIAATQREDCCAR